MQAYGTPHASLRLVGYLSMFSISFSLFVSLIVGKEDIGEMRTIKISLGFLFVLFVIFFLFIF
jgi:hypothetical protein